MKHSKYFMIDYQLKMIVIILNKSCLNLTELDISNDNELNNNIITSLSVKVLGESQIVSNI